MPGVKWLPSAEGAAALGGLVKGCLKTLSCANALERTSSSGLTSSHPTSTPQRRRQQSLSKPANVSSKVLHDCGP